MSTLFPKEPVVTQLSWSSDYSLLASADIRMEVTFWRLDSGRFLEVHDGPRLYAEYRAYDFEVDTNPFNQTPMPTEVRLTLDPDGACVTLRCGLSPGGSYIVKESDPSGYIKFESDLNDISWDTSNNTAYIHFRIRFTWDWPTEESNDVSLELFEDGNSLEAYIFQDVFSVENDLDFYGDMEASGQWQGSLHVGDWVRVAEEITVSGPVLVYENTTDIYPPDGNINATLKDDDGETSFAPIVRGTPVNISLLSDISTDLDEVITLSLHNLPGKAELVSMPRFPLRVDGSVPSFSGAVPDDECWCSRSQVMVSITVDDGNTSGVDESSLEYSYRTSQWTAFSRWTRVDLETVRAGKSVEGQAFLSLTDGDGNFIIWRARDRVGNYAQTEPMRIRVDTINVTFSDPLPGEYSWQCTLECLCGVTISDMAGSGIDVSSIQFRVSPRNLSQYGGWIDWDEGSIEDLMIVNARMYMKFSLSTYNYIQWRAMDIAGNGYTTAPHYRVMIDVESIGFSDFEPAEDLFNNERTVMCWIMARDGPGGSGVDGSRIEYRYSQSGLGYTDWIPAHMTGVHQEMRFSVRIEFADGLLNIVQFKGFDLAGNGPTISREYSVKVDSNGPRFINITPSPNERQLGKEVVVTFQVKDDLVGLNVSSVRYSYSIDGGRSYSEWVPIDVDQKDDFFIGRAGIIFAAGNSNRVRFMALDRSGNMGDSDSVVIWVNSLPRAVISQPRSDGKFNDAEPVHLSAQGSTDDDGDVLNYTWLLDGAALPEVQGKEGFSLLPPGVHNLTLLIVDGFGGEDQVTLPLTVDHVPPPRIRENDHGGMWIIILLFVLIIAACVSYIIWKRYRPRT